MTKTQYRAVIAVIAILGCYVALLRLIEITS